MAVKAIHRSAGNPSANTRAQSTLEMTPPLLHAVSGSLASALALLLFFPLERARIEMQTEAAAQTKIQIEPQPSLQEDEVAVEIDVPLFESAISDGDDPDILQVSNVPELSPTGSWIPCTTPSNTSPRSSSSNTSTNEEDIAVASWSMGSQPLAETDSNPCSLHVPPPESAAMTRKSKLLACLLKMYKHGDMYRGAAPVVLTITCSNFVFFYIHNALKRHLLSSPQDGANSGRPNHRPKQRPSMSMSLMASSLAGIINVLLTNPLWVANLRIVQGDQYCQSSSSLWAEIQNIFRKEGIQSLWNGTYASLLLVSNPVIQFFCYEQLKNLRPLSKSLPPPPPLPSNEASTHTIHTTTRTPPSLFLPISPLEAFFIGALAKAAATVVTYPLQLAQVLLRMQQKQKDQSPTATTATTTNDNKTATTYTGTLDCLQELYVKGGVQALYTGMDAKLLQTVLTAATTFLTYEQILRVIRILFALFVLRKKGSNPQQLHQR